MSRYPISPRLAKILCSRNVKFIHFLLCALLDSELDYKSSHCDNEKSEIISKVQLIIDYCRADDKEDFCLKNNLKKKKVDEILKLTKQLVKIRESEDNKKIEINFTIHDYFQSGTHSNPRRVSDGSVI